MTKKIKCCTLFSYVSFYLKVSRKVFNKTTCVMQLMNAMYSFLQEPFFPTEFLDGVFNEACAYRDNHPRWSVIKHTDSILERNKKEQS